MIIYAKKSFFFQHTQTYENLNLHYLKSIHFSINTIHRVYAVSQVSIG